MKNMSGGKELAILLPLALLVVVSTEILDCGQGNLTIAIEGGECGKSTCIGECLNNYTCCLAECFTGNRPQPEDFDGCSLDDAINCSDFENQTACLAGNLNKTFDVCWKHFVHFISTHPDVQRINGFNPVNCPCDSVQTRKPGLCSFQQCVNSSLCEENTDMILHTEVCCLHNDIFPKESDCESKDSLDDFVHASTIVQCQELCHNGLCKMPDPDRLPACCKRTQKDVKESTSGLHGAVVAVIVTVIIVLVFVGMFGLCYIYRIKKEQLQMKVATRHSNSLANITGIEEMIAKEENGDDNPSFNTKRYIQSQEPVRHVTSLAFGTHVHSFDKSQNGFQDDENHLTQIDYLDSESHSRKYRRRRSGNSGEFHSNADNVEYVFDDGKSDVSDKNIQYT